MSNSPTLNVNPLRGFSVWDISEIYLGPLTTSGGTTVPNVNDEVNDWSVGIYQVIAVDSTNYTPSLYLRFSYNNTTTAVSQYQPNTTMKAFVNNLVTPNTINIDDNYRAYAPESTYAVLYKGTDISSENAVILSQVYNGSGNFVNQNIPLQTIDTTNPAIKRPTQFNTNIALLDGSIVTLVIYSSSGIVTGTQQFLVKNTTSIKGLTINTVYITDIVLVSELLDATIVDMINVPAGIPLISSDFQARLLYSDGSTRLISIDNIKCRLLGIGAFNTNLAGVTSQVVLCYYPSTNEAAINLLNPALASISHTYNIRAVNNILDYSFKVYAVPVYNPSTQMFSLQFYLTNLRRNILIQLNTTQYEITLASGGLINYLPNGNAQQIRITVGMNSVLPAGGYGNYNFTQMLTVQFGNVSNTAWLLDYLNTGTAEYGSTIYAAFSTTGSNVVNISSNYATVFDYAGWLNALYYNLHPIFDQSVSILPPTPTHFQLSYKGLTGPIRSISSYWNINLPNDFAGSGINWVQYDTLSVIFLMQNLTDPSVYDILAVAPLLLVNTLT